MTESNSARDLVALAAQAATSAYVPYSGFRVGAAIRGERGIYLGTNVENASYGLALCAERSALSAAIAAGERNFTAIGIACIDAPADAGVETRVPCGACRQWLMELAPDAAVAMLGVDRDYTVRELLPLAFTLRGKAK